MASESLKQLSLLLSGSNPKSFIGIFCGINPNLIPTVIVENGEKGNFEIPYFPVENNPNDIFTQKFKPQYRLLKVEEFRVIIEIWQVNPKRITYFIYKRKRAD